MKEQVGLRGNVLTGSAVFLREFEMTQAEALTQLNTWGGQPLPLNASCWLEEAGVGTLYLRLRGALAAVEADRKSVV